MIRELRSLTRIAIPVAIAGSGVALMGVVDAAIVGRAGTVPLAAVGLANTLFFTLVIPFIGLMLGMDPLVSQSVGAGDLRRARGLVWQSVWLALLATAALTVPLAVTPLALEWLGIESPVAKLAHHCVWVRAPSLPFLLVYYVQRSYLIAMGRPRPILVASAVANLANLVFGLLFVFGGERLPYWLGPLRWVPALGAPGSSLSTALCTVLMAAILALSIRSVPLNGAPPSRRLDPSVLKKTFRVGLPVGLHMGAEFGSFSLVGFLAGRLGAAQLAAHQLALVYASLSFQLAVGIANAGSVRVGWAVGAKQPQQVRRSGLTAFAAGAGMMSAWGCIFFIFPRALARLMTDQVEVVSSAAPLLMVAAVFQIADGVQSVGAGALRGAADTRFTFYANMVGHYVVGIPVALLLGFYLGLGIAGLWWGLCVGLFLVAMALLVRFLRISSREIVPYEGSTTESAPSKTAGT